MEHVLEPHFEATADRDHAVVRDPTLERRGCAAGDRWQGDQARPLREGLVDDAPGGRVHAGVDDLAAPRAELPVEVVRGPATANRAGRPLLSRVITCRPLSVETDERQGKAYGLAEWPKPGITFGLGVLPEKGCPGKKAVPHCH